jgi:hypothetical protein
LPESVCVCAVVLPVANISLYTQTVVVLLAVTLVQMLPLSLWSSRVVVPLSPCCCS